MVTGQGEGVRSQNFVTSQKLLLIIFHQAQNFATGFPPTNPSCKILRLARSSLFFQNCKRLSLITLHPCHKFCDKTPSAGIIKNWPWSWGPEITIKSGQAVQHPDGVQLETQAANIISGMRGTVDLQENKTLCCWARMRMCSAYRKSCLLVQQTHFICDLFSVLSEENRCTTVTASWICSNVLFYLWSVQTNKAKLRCMLFFQHYLFEHLACSHCVFEN